LKIDKKNLKKKKNNFETKTINKIQKKAFLMNDNKKTCWVRAMKFKKN